MSNHEKFEYEKYMWEEKSSCSYFLTQGFKVIFALLGVFVGVHVIIFGLVVTLLLGITIFKSFFPPAEIARLDIATIDDLCQQFNLAPEDRLCSHDQPVYGDDFFPVIKDEFKVYFTSYEEIQAKLAPYQIRRDDPQAEKNPTITSFFASYDLAGDHEAIIVFRLDRNDILHDINYSSINRDEDGD